MARPAATARTSARVIRHLPSPLGGLLERISARRPDGFNPPAAAPIPTPLNSFSQIARFGPSLALFARRSFSGGQLPDRIDSSPVVPEGTILGLDNVFLTLPIAGVGSRVLAAFLDTLIQTAIQLVWLMVWFLPARSTLGAWTFVVYVFGAFTIDSTYFAGSEILMRGRTLGKKAVGLRVVTRAGGTAGAGALLTRNLVRIVDLLVGVPLMAIDPLARRLGDRLAGTIVVHDRESKPETLLRRIPAGWQGEDVALVEALIRRAGDLEPARAESMAQTVIARLEREQPEFLVGVWRDGGALAAVRHAFGAETV